MLSVQVPAGMEQGMMLQVNAPDGTPVQFQIPPGAKPGTMLNIPLPTAEYVPPQQLYPIAQPVVASAAPRAVVMTTTTTTTVATGQGVAHEHDVSRATAILQPMRTVSYCGPLSWFVGICFFWPIVFCPIDQRQVPMRS